MSHMAHLRVVTHATTRCAAGPEMHPSIKEPDWHPRCAFFDGETVSTALGLRSGTTIMDRKARDGFNVTSI